jgi:hypothetical protein
MKRCPTCNRAYADETLRFCLDDGAPLVSEGASSRDPYETLRISAPRSTDPVSAENSAATAPRPSQAAQPKREIYWLIAATAIVSAIALIGVSYLYVSRGRHKGASSQQATTNAAPSATQAPEGRWFIMIGTYPKTDLNKANERLSFVRYKGYDARLIDTDDYPNMKDGLWAVVLGPYRKDYAQELADKVRAVFPDAYVKSGW